MSTKSKIAVLVALATVIAAPAFAGQRVNSAQHSAPAGAYAPSVSHAGARVSPVQPRVNNNLNPDFQLGGDN